MKLTIPTPCLQSWQLDGWIEQGYSITSIVPYFEGEIVHVTPGSITICGGIGKLITVESIPTTDAYFDGDRIIVGRSE